ncbi:MAG: cysteine peptidase family C39 domain-containing protein, partial [Pseudomonadota bacterium]
MTSNLQNMNEEPFDSLFVRQQDETSCGPACLATVARLYRIPGVSYESLRRLLPPEMPYGVFNFRMVEVSRACLPFENAGEDCYAGGVAIANITESEGHYVVFLCGREEDVVYYDPYTHKITAAW